jgi:hypothetical protein
VRAILVLLFLAASAAGAEARAHRTTVVAQAETSDAGAATDAARDKVKGTEKRRAKLATSRAAVSAR